MKKLLILILVMFLADLAIAQKYKPEALRYIKTSHGYTMVLQKGDTLFKELERLALNEKIPSASFTGFGFVDATFGYFDQKTKTYSPKTFTKVEMASMTGSIAWQNDSVSIHAHGIVTGKNFKAYGGHLLSAYVGNGSLEIYIILMQEKAQRVKDENIGANILCVDECR